MSYLLHDVLPVMTRDSVMQKPAPVGFYADLAPLEIVSNPMGRVPIEEMQLRVGLRYALYPSMEMNIRREAERNMLHHLYAPAISKLAEIRGLLYCNYGHENGEAIQAINQLLKELTE